MKATRKGRFCFYSKSRHLPKNLVIPSSSRRPLSSRAFSPAREYGGPYALLKTYETFKLNLRRTKPYAQPGISAVGANTESHNKIQRARGGAGLQACVKSPPKKKRALAPEANEPLLRQSDRSPPHRPHIARTQTFRLPRRWMRPRSAPQPRTRRL